MVLHIVYEFALNPSRRTVKTIEYSLKRTDTITAEQALEDLTYYYKIIKNRHPVFLDGPANITSDFDKQYKKYSDLFTSYIESAHAVSIREMDLALWAMANTIHDSHTYIVNNFEREETNPFSGENFQQDIDNWVYFSLDLANDLGIFVLKECNYDALYQETVNAFFTHVNHYNIKNIVVDLRDNSGGNSLVANEFISYLGNVDSYNTMGCKVRIGPFMFDSGKTTQINQKQEEQFFGNVWILTNNETFSSAMLFAQMIQDNGIGHIVGFTSGNKPEHYGDVLYFRVPNSKITFSCSYKKWSRIDQSKKDQYLIPDYQVPSEKAMQELYKLIKTEK